MSLGAALEAIESDEERERERAIPALIASESPEALVALERVAQHDDNLQLRFLAKEGALQLRQRLSGTIAREGGGGKDGPLDISHLKSRLMDADAKRRLRGVRSALATKDRRALKYLNQLLPKEPDPKVAVELCLTIGGLGGKGDGEALVERLRDPRPEIRVAAVRGLGYLRDKNVYPTLVAMLSDKHKDVRAKAFEVLTKLGRPKLVRLLVRMLGSSREWPRKAAVRACAKLNSPEFADILQKARENDPSARIRREAAKALLHLSRKGNAEAAAILAKHPPEELDQKLPSTEGLVMEGASHGAQAPSQDAAQAEIERLRAEVAKAKAEAEAAKAAAQASSQPDIPPPPAMPLAPATPGEAGSSSSSVSSNLPAPPLEMLNLDEDDDPDVSELEDLELSTAEVMVGGLNDPDADVRMENIKEILSQKDRALAPQLAARLPLETDLKVLAKLILAVGKLGRKKDARRLQQYLRHEEKRIRANAVEALSMLGDEQSLRACIPLLDDIDNRTRANAVVALKDVEDVDVVAVLKEMAKHPDLDMRLSAVYASLEIATPEVDPVLQFLLKDKEQEVKDKALSAMNLLEDQRMAPLQGKAVDMDSTMARMEKLSAWRGELVDEDEDEHDGSVSASDSRSVSKSLDEQANALLGGLEPDSEEGPEAEKEKGKAAGNWGRMPKTSIPKSAESGGEGGLKGIWDNFLEYLTNPNPQPKKPAPSGGDEQLSRRNVIMVVGITVSTVVVLWSMLGGGGGGDEWDVGDDF